MATIVAENILSRVDTTLFDETRARWTQLELLQYLSDGQRMTVQLRPEANPKNEVVQLIAGTRQGIPAAGFQLLDGHRAEHGDQHDHPWEGGPPSRTQYSRPHRPGLAWWAGSTISPADAEVRNFTYDTKDRYHFYVYPAQPAAVGSVELIYSAAPAEISDAATVIEIDDIYEPNLYHFMMYRALIKDAPAEDFRPDLAQEHYRLFATPLLGKAQVDALLFPLQQMEREGR